MTLPELINTVINTTREVVEDLTDEEKKQEEADKKKLWEIVHRPRDPLKTLASMLRRQCMKDPRLFATTSALDRLNEAIARVGSTAPIVTVKLPPLLRARK